MGFRFLPCIAPRQPRAAPRLPQAAGLLLAASLWASGVPAQDIGANTWLLNLSQGSGLTDLVDRLGTGGYELSNGERVDFAPWYPRRWTDLHLDMLSQITPDFGITWGVSTGESGPKYRIAPGFKLGFMWQLFQTGNSELTLSATTVIGGGLTERPCTADYGEIGGIQQVNCRLAATPIPPGETLRYLVRADAPEDGVLSLTYTIRF